MLVSGGPAGCCGSAAAVVMMCAVLQGKPGGEQEIEDPTSFLDALGLRCTQVLMLSHSKPKPA